MDHFAYMIESVSRRSKYSSSTKTLPSHAYRFYGLRISIHTFVFFCTISCCQANRLRKEQEATKDAMQESLHQLEQYQKYQRIKPQNRKLLKASKLYEKATLSPVGYSNHNHSGAAVYQSPSTQEYQTFPDDENFN